MNVHEAVGITVEIFLMLLGLCSVIYVAYQGSIRLRGHLDIGRLDEDRAVRDHLDMRGQLERLQR